MSIFKLRPIIPSNCTYFLQYVRPIWILKYNWSYFFINTFLKLQIWPPNFERPKFCLWTSDSRVVCSSELLITELIVWCRIPPIFISWSVSFKIMCPFDSLHYGIRYFIFFRFSSIVLRKKRLKATTWTYLSRRYHFPIQWCKIIQGPNLELCRRCWHLLIFKEESMEVDIAIEALELTL